MSDHSELKKLAEYATPGPWVAHHPNAGQRGSEVASGGGLNQVCADLGPTNALYIAAANPAAVLALIDEVEALRSQVGTLQSDANSWQSGYDEGRRMGTKTALDEREELRKDAERYRWLNSDAASDSGMIPEFDGEKWIVIYLDNGAGGSGGGVCEAIFSSANEAVDFSMSKGAKP